MRTPQRKSNPFIQLVPVGVAIALAIVVGWLFFQSYTLQGYTNATPIPGVGLGEIRVKQTTLGQVERILGKRYQRVTSDKTRSTCNEGICQSRNFQEIGLRYEEVGLGFAFIQFGDAPQPESNLVLQAIYINCVKQWGGCRFTGKTERGIRLGTTRKEVVTAYGQDTQWGPDGRVRRPEGINIGFEPREIGNYSQNEDDTVSSLVIYAVADFEEYR